MDATPHAYAYRCLPLTLANAHGWEVLTGLSFSAVWDGSQGAEGVRIKGTGGQGRLPVSLFGSGIITFHLEGVFRTSPGWNLWVGGSPNYFISNLHPLTGVVETHWNTTTFTMNWKIDRPNVPVHFPQGAPFCFLMPVPHAVLEQVEPRFAPMSSDPELEAEFLAWTRSRDSFHAKMREAPPQRQADTWQREYFQGRTTLGAQAPDHRTKLRLRPFTHG